MKLALYFQFAQEYVLPQRAMAAPADGASLATPGVYVQ